MRSLNMQPGEKITFREDGVLDVFKVFYTVQGEGPFAGQPAVFIRLAGCDLQCPQCDTDYTSQRQEIPTEQLLMEVNRVCSGGIWWRKNWKPLIVFTGGEPLRQNIGPAVRVLLEADYINVQIETNGSCFQPEVPYLPITVVCSPKTPTLNRNLIPHIKHLKYVIEYGKVDESGFPESTLGNHFGVCRPWPGFSGTIWVQPLDTGDPLRNKANADECVRVAMKFGYRVSVQTHKLLGVE